MMTINQYVRPKTLQEAYELAQKKRNVVLGGMLWLKMQNMSVDTAIDLCGLGLDKIEENDEEYRIGAMVSLRTLEKHEGLNKMTGGALAEALKHIVGVQFRNTATVGGSLYGRFGFSDVLTVMMAMNAKVELFHAGVMELEEFAGMPRRTRDILVQVIVPKTADRLVYLSQRNTATDFPVLACAVGFDSRGAYAVVGARPAKARRYRADMGDFGMEDITEETAKIFAGKIVSQVYFDSNLRASSGYRRKVCEVLIRRALLQMKGADVSDGGQCGEV